MTVYCDDYGIVDVSYIVHACSVDPCADEEHEHPQPQWVIGLILHVGNEGYPCAITYPSRALRDAAFEAIVALVKREALEAAEEDEA